jgi:membrane-associated phospholipid phosphatase
LALPSWTRYVTDAGDSGVLVPVVLVSAGVLWFFHSRRVAWLQLRSVLAAIAVIAVLKLMFLSCGVHWGAVLTSPSGHACLSMVVYGTLASLLAGGRPPAARAAIYAVTGLVVGAIAVTRVALGVHTWIEVVVGLLVGGLAFAWFAWSYTRLGPQRLQLRSFGLAVLLTAVVVFGVRLPAESFLRHLARRMGDNCALSLPQDIAAAAPLQQTI